MTPELRRQLRIATCGGHVHGDDLLRALDCIDYLEKRLDATESATASTAKHAGCVSPQSSDTCVYLRDGNKVVLHRDGMRAWLEVVPQAEIRASALDAATPPKGERT